MTFIPIGHLFLISIAIWEFFHRFFFSYPVWWDRMRLVKLIFLKKKFISPSNYFDFILVLGSWINSCKGSRHFHTRNILPVMSIFFKNLSFHTCIALIFKRLIYILTRIWINNELWISGRICVALRVLLFDFF